ncbi:translation initiation factor IF-2 [Desulfolutivibrio sulfoxidireducens]|uniref:translation initiation factor IF-2 n=1 Tax=Desulfolutivibrio sulfoxidireducens TaxID=2773299 RepID=UPI00159E8B06|nr:translation initiation factor IF-2 [Desulfolutivibrio sulfoxidireducens]QLA16872.1 translation initiation factor IF-2 [Desulfolutivibrio sulfoxidireducens]
MSNIRVKDLAKELGVGNKEILQILRELGIQAKSQMGALTEEEASQVRLKARSMGGATRVIDTEVQPGVIVRRRKPARDRQAPESEAAPAPGAEHPEPVSETPEAPAAPLAPPEIVSEAGPETTAAEIAEPRAKRPAKPAPVETRARIISQPAQPEPEAPEPEPAPPVVHAEMETAAVVEAVEEAEAVSELAPEAIAAPEAPEASGTTPADAGTPPPPPPQAAGEEESRGDKKKRRPRREPPATPQVRIISMPEPKPEVVTPVAAPAAPGAAAPKTETEEERRKKGKKDRRTVEFTPTPVESEESRRKSAAAKKKKTPEVHDRTGGRAKSFRRKKPREEFQPAPQQLQAGTQPLKAAKRKIRMEETIRVAELAKQMGIKAQDLIKVLLGLGAMVTINQSLDVDTTVLAAGEFGYEVEKVGFSEEEFLLDREIDNPEDLRSRPPVVTIMGHVDHGKTSLLDAVRASNITSGEAGGITQHIGAYHVATSRGAIVFLDTPGHEAFTAMRARGAQVTDIVVLVVAADDGVMDQTREAVNHAKAAHVPIVVAVNKIDKPDANPDRVMRELGDLGLVPEAWGGETIFANVSAKQKIGLDALLEMILLQAEVLELKANPAKRARGHIVEARLDKGRGPVGTILIQEGTLKQGDAFVCGVVSGRVRAMFDDQGKKIREAGPAMPVEVQGFESVPEAGDEFVGVEDDKVARRIADARSIKQRERELGKATKVTLETFLAAKPDAEAQTLNLVLKADVQGSLEAITESLNKLSTDKVKVSIIHAGAGAITESDILLASASQAIIIGFNVRPTVKVKDVADRENVDIRFYDIIYKLVGDIKDAMSGMLAPIIREQYLGQAEVRDTFSVPKVGLVAGCGVLDGKLTRSAGIRLLRDGVVVYTGRLASLKRFKDDVKEVTKGYECGVGLENYNDVKIGDVIEAFESVEEKATLD